MTVPNPNVPGRFTLSLVVLILQIWISEALVPSGHFGLLRTRPEVGVCRLSTILTQSRSNEAVATKSKKPKKKGGQRPGGSPRNIKALTEEELVNHVSTKYLEGARGSNFARDIDDSDGLDSPEHAEYVRQLDKLLVLVLNADYQPLNYAPLSVWNWQDAVKAIFGGKVTVVDVYPEMTIRAANIEVPLPSVIALNDYVPFAGQQKPAFTRRNVFLRDEYTCQYCGGRFHTSHLTLDHVTPRCRGGILKWDNAVTSCQVCNGRKGSRTLKELRSIGMSLRREPVVPSQFDLAARAAKMVPKKVHQTWTPYLGFVMSQMSSSSSSSSSASSANDSEEMEL